MKTVPISTSLYDYLVKNNVTEFTLHFNGVSDEARLYVDCKGNEDTELYTSIIERIEDWAWSVYDYSKAGDDFDEVGDVITYDLKNKKIISQEWYTKTHVGEEIVEDFPLN
jgi:hypothetical protein